MVIKKYHFRKKLFKLDNIVFNLITYLGSKSGTSIIYNLVSLKDMNKIVCNFPNTILLR